MTVTTTSARHLLIRLGDGAKLPEALLGTLRDEIVLAGWLRASGVLADVHLRAYDANAKGPGGGGLSPSRRIAGPVQAVVLEGSIGLANGDVTCGLRAVLSRETETGIETFAGEIAEARVVALEAMVTALDDAAAARAVDRSGVWLFQLDGTKPERAPAPAAAAPAAAAPEPPRPWAEAVRASAPEPPPPPPPRPQPAAAQPAAAPHTGGGPRPSPTFTPQAMPQRPQKPAMSFDEQVYPDAGDTVEHFAFGRCEVVKSDGDRLHVRLGKDGRIKEISLDMLKVTELPAEEGLAGRHFKLDRKL